MKTDAIFLKLFIYCLILFSCTTVKKNMITISSEVEVIKFMGTITTQSRSIDEKAFWYFKDEHAILKIRNNNFIENLQAIKDHSRDDFEEYRYAFIVKTGQRIDTLYSDAKLKTWILKKDKQETFFYDREGVIAHNLRNTYSFFYDCW